ncbi:MAG TPA: peptidase C39 family protein [Mariprofundaceae bacterium]|nr:peptidase C39 family protein [Mariprofundaceae bacterium]
MIRHATLDDVPALAELENRSFETDRISPRSFRHLLKSGHSSLLVDEEDGRIRAYSLVLFHRNTSIARLYSFTVDAAFRGQGLGRKLLAAAEDDALANGSVSMRLEVRPDNPAATHLYLANGYKQFDVAPDYYEDHMDALRMEKALAPHLSAESSRVPYYPQTLEFTCGPATLMMAMKALRPEMTLDRMLELRLWREATTIFMTSGHGGCGPLGLALSAHNRGFAVELYVSSRSNMFVDSVRSEEKKEVIRLVQADLFREIKETDIGVHRRMLALAEMEKAFEKGAVPLVLVSAYRLSGDKSPHWVVVTGFDKRFVYVHEPYVDIEEGVTDTLCIGIPIAREEFERMTRYGKTRQFAAILISNRSK